MEIEKKKKRSYATGQGLTRLELMHILQTQTFESFRESLEVCVFVCVCVCVCGCVGVCVCVCVCHALVILLGSGALHCGALWCSVVQRGAAWCSVVQRGAVWCSVV